MALLCCTCSSLILPRQHKLVCLSCGLAAHRRCFPNIPKADFPSFRQNWKCLDCSTSSALSFPLNLDASLLNSSSETIILSTPQVQVTSTSWKENMESTTRRQLDQDISKLKNSKGLKIGHMNINSIRNKFEDVVVLLSECPLDLVAFTESKLDSDRDHSVMFSIDGYDTFRFDREYNKGGGIIIYFKSQLNCELIEHSIIVGENSELCIIKLNLTRAKPLLICCVYSHPSVPKTKVVDLFRSLNCFLCSQSLEYFIMGDFNYNLMQTCPDSFQLFFACREFGLWQYVKKPTFKGQSLLDHIYSNKKVNIVDSGQFPFAGSDHDFTYVIRKATKHKYQPLQITYRKYSDLDTTKLSKLFDEFQITAENNVSEQMISYNNHILNCLDNFAPLKKRFVKPQVNNWYTADLAKLRKSRDKLHRLANKTKLPLDIKAYRQARSHYSSNLTKAKKKYFNEGFNETLGDTVGLWNNVNELTSFRKKSAPKINKLLDPTNDIIVDKPNDINEILANQFLIKSPSFVSVTDIDVEIENYCNSYNCNELGSWQDFSLVTNNDVKEALKLTKKDTTNEMYVPLKILKVCEDVVSIHLAKLFTIMFWYSIVPQCFKSAIVTPLYKGKGVRNCAANYRPISCLIVYCKLFERVLFSRIQDRIEAKLCPQQHGFRRNRSCQTALDEFTKFIYSSLDNPNFFVLAIYYDAKSAFDSVDRNLLLRKLMSEYELHPVQIKLIRNYFKDRSIKIKGDCNYHSSTTGLAQGASVCPLLYSAYQNSISKIITTNFILYADDCVVYVAGSDLSELFKIISNQAVVIQKWYDDNNMIVNYSKTKYQIFHKPQVKIPAEYTNFKLMVGDNCIEQVSSFKYLGVWFDSCLTFKGHLTSVLNRVSGNLSYLYGIKRYLTENVMTMLVNCNIHSIIDYGIEVWAVQSSAQLNVIQKKVDAFICNYFLPAICKKARNRKLPRGRIKININDYRTKHNIFSLEERRDLFLLKYAFRHSDTNNMDNGNRSRSWPLMSVPRCNTKFSQNSINYRSILLWNALPREWIREGMMYSKFVNECKNLLIKKRDCDYVFF